MSYLVLVRSVSGKRLFSCLSILVIKGQGRRVLNQPRADVHVTPTPRFKPLRVFGGSYRMLGASTPCSCRMFKYLSGAAAMRFAQPGQQM